MFEDLSYIARRDLIAIRNHEKNIQFFLVRQSRIPRKDFLESFPSNATKIKWIDTLIKNKKYSNSKKQLEDVKADVVIAQKSMKAIEDRLGMSIKDIKEKSTAPCLWARRK